MTPAVTTFHTPALDPVVLIRALGLEGLAPVVLLDSAGGSPQLARRSLSSVQPDDRGQMTVVAASSLY